VSGLVQQGATEITSKAIGPFVGISIKIGA